MLMRMPVAPSMRDVLEQRAADRHLGGLDARALARADAGAHERAAHVRS
jgi:hypothetical protein